MNAQQIVATFENARIRYLTESAMHADIASHFAQSSIQFVPECSLGNRDRIDFLCFGVVGIECKVSGQMSAVLSQLLRYAENPQVESLVLVTSKAAHRRLATLDTLLGKPFYVVFVAFNSL